MRAVIYIGHFKTGSSSLQRFLAANYVALLKQGILYPAVESRAVAFNMAAILKGVDHKVAEGSINSVEPHNALALRLKNEEDGHEVPSYYPNLPPAFHMLELVSQQMKWIQPKTVALAAEVFTSLAATEEHMGIKRLARRLDECEVDLICNLRRPDEQIASWHLQRLKFSAKLRSLRGAGMDRYFKTMHFDYARLVDGWSEVFPDARFRIGNFEEVRKSGGTVAQFVDVLGPDDPKAFRQIRDHNLSMPRAFWMIARMALHQNERDTGSEIVKCLLAAPSALRRIDDKDVEVFGKKNRQKLADAFGPVYDRLMRKSGTLPLFADLGAIREVLPVSDLDAAAELWPGLKDWLSDAVESEAAKRWIGGCNGNFHLSEVATEDVNSSSEN
jgi:hypothetical protein